MIRPAKYLDLTSSTINVAALIVIEIASLKAIKIDELNEVIVDRLGDDAKVNFLSALTLLYAVGKLDYDSKSDAIISLIGDFN